MNESIGARLREAREKRKLSLQQASDTTKVRTHYLQALESDDLSAIPSTAQARGFLRIYAEFLGVQIAELVPSPGPEAAAPDHVEPKAGTDGGTNAGTNAPRLSMLDNVRALLSRRVKPEVDSAASEADGKPDITSSGPAVGEEPGGSPNSAKKKRGKRRRAAK